MLSRGWECGMAKALTTKAAEAVRPTKKRQEIPDGIVQGLYLVVQPSGAKSYALRFRFAGKPVKLTLGRFSPTGEGGLSVAQARAAAGEGVDQVERGETLPLKRRPQRRRCSRLSLKAATR